MTWAVSRTPRNPRSARSLRPATIPSGTPMSRATATATSINARVTMVSSQKPRMPHPKSAMTAAAAARAPPVRQPITPTSASTPGQRSWRRTQRMASVACSTPSAIGWKNHVNSQCRSLLRTVQSYTASTAGTTWASSHDGTLEPDQDAGDDERDEDGDRHGEAPHAGDGVGGCGGGGDGDRRDGHQSPATGSTLELDLVGAGDHAQGDGTVDAADDLAGVVDDGDRMIAPRQGAEHVAHLGAERHLGDPVPWSVGRRHDGLDREHVGPRHVAHEHADVVVGRRADHLGRRTDLDEAPVTHDGDAVAEAQRLDEVVGDEDHGRGQLAAQPDDLVLHVPADHRVEGGERFVEQQHLGTGGQRAGEPDALLHAARELIGAGRAEAGQADQLEELLGSGPPDLLVDALDLEAERHVVQQVPVRQQAEVLEDHAHAVPAQVQQLRLRRRRDVEVADADGAGGRLDEPGQATDERRLATARQPHHHERLAGLDVEVDVAHGSDVARARLQLAAGEIGER